MQVEVNKFMQQNSNLENKCWMDVLFYLVILSCVLFMNELIFIEMKHFHLRHPVVGSPDVTAI